MLYRRFAGERMSVPRNRSVVVGNTERRAADIRKMVAGTVCSERRDPTVVATVAPILPCGHRLGRFPVT